MNGDRRGTRRAREPWRSQHSYALAATAMSAACRAGIDCDALSFRFGGLVAIADMTFEVREGEVLSLIGPNGAGKTSAFNAITGFLQAPARRRSHIRGTALTA